MKIYTNELGHMTNLAAMPIYGKNILFKLWPWVDLDPFYAKVKFGLYTQVSDSGPHGPLVYISAVTVLLSQATGISK